MKCELHIDLIPYAADSHVPRAENATRFVKERLRSIQSETPFTQYLRRLTIKMIKRVTVLIDSFRRKSGVHFVLLPREIIFGKTFKTLLCKMGELVFAYDVQANNKLSRPRAFFTLCIRPNDEGTRHSVFKLSTKKMIIIPRCKPAPMPDNVIEIVNRMEKDEKIPDRIHFCNILKESTLDDMNGKVNSQNDSSCTSNKSWNMSKNRVR